MDRITLRNASAPDFDAIVRPNAAEVQHTIAMCMARLTRTRIGINPALHIAG